MASELWQGCPAFGPRRGLDGLFESGRTGIAELGLRAEADFKVARIELTQLTLPRGNFSRVVR
jgi:hypothetical protein